MHILKKREKKKIKLFTFLITRMSH